MSAHSEEWKIVVINAASAARGVHLGARAVPVALSNQEVPATAENRVESLPVHHPFKRVARFLDRFNKIVLLLVVMAAMARAGAHPMIIAALGPSIRGTVKDASGGKIPGVNVQLTDLEKGTTRSVLSDDSGCFQFMHLSPGNYELKAEREGFCPYCITGIRLRQREVLKLNVVMKVSVASDCFWEELEIQS